MGSVHSRTEQRRSRRRFTIAESSIRSPNVKGTEPKHKTKDVQMYHIYGITESMRGSRRSVAITDLYNVCVDISFVKRHPVDGIV